MSGERVHTARLRRQLFEAWGSSDDPVFVAKAPGRVNLIGEHTDYNLGLALPAAIGLELFIAFRPRTDRRVELHSLAFGETRAFDLDDLDQPRAGSRGVPTWIDYVAGMAWALARAGIGLRGVQGVIDTRLPVGSGLASSAALELASAWTLIDPERSSDPTPHRLAVLAHQAEEEFVGVRSGMMDQVAASLGRKGHVLMLDCRSMEAQPIPILSDIALVVCDSGVPRRLAESAYNQRRAECEEGVRLLRRHLPRVESLRDVGVGEFERWKGELPETVGRRCAHVILENERVRAAVRALRSRSMKELGPLFAESHASLRDLYEVSSPELDTLVEAALGIDGVVGARLTGAGFGGCTVNLVERDSVEEFRRTVTNRYTQRTGQTVATYAVETADGAGLVPT